MEPKNCEQTYKLEVWVGLEGMWKETKRGMERKMEEKEKEKKDKTNNPS